MEPTNNESNPYEPKRENRHVTDFHKQLGIQEWMIDSVDKPKLVEDKGGGYFRWVDMKIELRDPLYYSPISKLFELRNDPYKLDVFHIRNLDSAGYVFEEWEVKPEKITMIDFGGRASNDNSDIQKLSICIRPEYCKLTKS